MLPTRRAKTVKLPPPKSNPFRRVAYPPTVIRGDPVVPTHAPRARAQRQRLERQMTKTPWLGLEMPARAYRGGDFVVRLLNDFNGGQRPRPRG